MHEGKEEDTSAGTLEENKPSLLPAVGDTIDLDGGTLVFCQEVPTYQLIQGMHTILAHIVSRSMNRQGLDQNADLQQRHVTVQRTLDLIKEEAGNYPYTSLLSCIQPLELRCRVSENGISITLCTMADYEISVVP